MGRVIVAFLSIQLTSPSKQICRMRIWGAHWTCYLMKVIMAMMTALILTPTTVAGVKRSPASVCASVCLSVRSITQKLMIPRSSNFETWYRECSWYILELIWFFSQKVKGQGHITKCKKNIFQAIEWLACVSTSIEYTASGSYGANWMLHAAVAAVVAHIKTLCIL